MFSLQEKRQLLQYVRQILENEFAGGNSTVPPPAIDALNHQGCCFVTLWECGEIRGCIGSCEPFETLAANLERNTLNAAFSDPGVPPLEPDELSDIRLEITIPGKMEPVTPTQARPDVDGTVLIAASRRALFLPQTVRQQNWNRETALDCLARKAGVSAPGDLHAPGAQLLRFEVETFSE